MFCESSFSFLRLSGKFDNVLAYKSYSSILDQCHMLRLFILRLLFRLGGLKPLILYQVSTKVFPSDLICVWSWGCRFCIRHQSETESIRT